MTMAGVYRIYPKQKKSFFSNLSITSNLILINVIFFILVLVLLSIGILPENFFNSNIAISLENIKQLRLWTFFTSMFMHAGLFHLFVNMLSLFFIGSLIERILGAKRYIYFYLISGLFAGVLYVFF